MGELVQPPGPESQGDFFTEKRDAIEKLPWANATLAWLGEHGFHPNRITSGRLLLVLPAAYLQTIYPEIAATLYSISLVLDWGDGAVARAMKDGITKVGAKLDPLIDKVGSIAMLMTQITLMTDDVFYQIATLLNVVPEYTSQRQRGPLDEQFAEGIEGTLHPYDCESAKRDDPELKKLQANTQGKIKLALQSVSILAFVLKEHVAHIYEVVTSVVDQAHAVLPTVTPEDVQTGASVGLIVSAGLAVWGTLKRWWGVATASEKK